MAKNIPSLDKEFRNDRNEPMLDCSKGSDGRQIFIQHTNFTEPELVQLYEEMGSDLKIYLSTGRNKT